MDRARGTERAPSGRTGGNRGTAWMLRALLAFVAWPLAACQTCVTGSVTVEGLPACPVMVELLDQNGNYLAAEWTFPSGEYCFNEVPLNRALVVRACVAGTCQQAAVRSGSSPGRCGVGPCTEAETIDFACSPADPLEPNDTCETASRVDLPYTDPLRNLCPFRDVDFFEFEVAAEGKTLLATVRNPGTGWWYVDTLLGLMDGACNPLPMGPDWPTRRIEVPAIPPGTYRLAVTGWGDWQFAGDHNELGPYSLDIRLADPACVNVIVTQNGEPLADAQVYQAREPWVSCWTDSSGACCFEEFQGVEAGYWICHPQTGECVEAATTPTLAGSCAQGGCEELRFDFDYTCVSGTVTREGVPVEGARIALWCSGSYSTWTQSGPDGAFCLTAPTESDCTLNRWGPLDIDPPVEGTPIHTGSGGNCVEGGCTEVALEVPGLTCVSGVVAREGEPLAGIAVCDGYQCSNTDAAGRYCIQAPKESFWTLYLWDPVTGEHDEETVLTGNTGSCEEGGCAEADFSLPAVACIQGVVTREGGVPARSVVVYTWPFGQDTGTDDEGRYCVEVPVDTEVMLDFYDPVTGHWTTRVVSAAGPGSCLSGGGGCTEVDVVDLPPAACVSGVVLRGDEPQQGIEVCSHNYGYSCDATDAQGTFCLEAVPYSSHYVEARDPVLGTYVTASVLTYGPGACPDGGCVPVTLRFQETGCLSGVVREGTEPLPGAFVGNPYGWTRTDDLGRYCLPAAAGQTDWIRAEHPADGSWIQRYPKAGSGGSCEEGGCTTQNFTFDLRFRR